MKKNSHINTEWHKKNRMPKNPTLEQRIQWHVEHLKNCSCRRELPQKLQLEMKKRGIRIPHQMTLTKSSLLDDNRL